MNCHTRHFTIYELYCCRPLCQVLVWKLISSSRKRRKQSYIKREVHENGQSCICLGNRNSLVMCVLESVVLYAHLIPYSCKLQSSARLLISRDSGSLKFTVAINSSHFLLSLEDSTFTCSNTENLLIQRLTYCTTVPHWYRC